MLPHGRRVLLRTVSSRLGSRVVPASSASKRHRPRSSLTFHSEAFPSSFWKYLDGMRGSAPSSLRSLSAVPGSSTSTDGSPQSSKAGHLEKDGKLPDINVFFEDLKRAAAWNHGKAGKLYDKTLWDPPFCRSVVDRYEAYLQAALNEEEHYRTLSDAHQRRLFSATTVNLALKALLKGHYDPPELSQRVRQWERTLGSLQQTPLSDQLSFRLIAANGKAGNVGRVLSLLQLRKKYPARRQEFEYAIRSLQASQWVSRRSKRNPFLSDDQQAAMDNPTRWLDSILLNMHQRGFPLDTDLANQMLACYAAGWSGKAVHHFYRIQRQPLASLPADERPAQTDGMPKEWVYVPNNDDDDDVLDSTFSDESVDGDISDDDEEGEKEGSYSYEPVKVQLRYHRAAPPFYKVPTQVRGTLLPPAPNSENKQHQFKLDREREPEYSYPLAAAFSFGESLQHGACGHQGIAFNTQSYNALIKASVQRGALWRAMQVLDEVMLPSPEEANCRPNTMSFNLILAGLARVGDVTAAQDYYMKLLAAGLNPDAFTVRAIVDGLLNLGDLSTAVTVVQDFFNQHCMLPPYTTHLKVLEFCLARDMVYEAKRYVSFLQQLHRWEPNVYHTVSFRKLMKATQANTQLQKESLQQLFAYFGEEIKDTDFV